MTANRHGVGGIGVAVLVALLVAVLVPVLPATAQQGGSVVSGRVWFDQNRNGLQDPDEAGLADVAFELVSFDPGQEPLVISTGETDTEGRYGVTAVPPGFYLVVVQLPEGLLFGPLDAGDDDSIDNDFAGNTERGGADGAFVEGETRTNVDAGLIRDVRGDANCDGALNILDAFATAQYVVELREGIETCPLAASATQISLHAVAATTGEPVTIQTAFQVSQCVVGLVNSLCPAEPGL